MPRGNRSTAKLKLGDWVRLTWQDASSHDEGWTEAENLENTLQICVSAGVVAKKDKTKVLLAMSRGQQGPEFEPQYATTLAVPIAWIQRIEIWPET